MKIYIVQGCEPYEDTRTYGIYKHEYKAKLKLKALIDYQTSQIKLMENGEEYDWVEDYSYWINESEVIE